ncbi:MAG: hypothetical protein GWP91_23330, partial [Rhodobacterales bacterium]|nr:hypothetical protein [Rhodobacterales bacterium]
SAAEICDLEDNDCDGFIDDNDPDVVLTVWNADLDRDGYGTPTNTIAQCNDPGADWTLDDRDCNDTDSSINPFGLEICDFADNNCDGAVDDADNDVTGQPSWYVDLDGDGYGSGPADTTCLAAPGWVTNNQDCDDNLPTVSPAVTVEFCNGFDDNCNGFIDDADITTTLADGLDWYPDTDSDDYGDENASPVAACVAPANHVQDDTDCADSQAAINPGVFEECDGFDNNCDGLTDDADPSLFGGTLWRLDADSDGYGTPTDSVLSCEAPFGYIPNGAPDCDDTNAAVYPLADEVCNGYDDDCDTFIDDLDGNTTNRPIWYLDVDSDGYGRTLTSQESCAQPGGYVANQDDCDDNNNAFYPGAVEVCNGFDDNCNGLTDDEDTPVFNTNTYYADADADSYGASTNGTVEACRAPDEYTPDNHDCNDNNYFINPNGNEICDGVDNDCDTLIDDADPDVEGAPIWYLDTDGDGYGGIANPQPSCDAPFNGYASADDCLDTNLAVHPGAIEICDGLDNNCDGAADDANANLVGGTVYYADLDGDGFGDATSGLSACGQESGYVSDNTDCADDDPSLYPGQTLTVSMTGAGYTVIQSAVDDACDEGVIQVLPGTYFGSIDYIGKNLVIRGIDPSNPPILGGAFATTVNAGSNEPVGAALENFVIRNTNPISSEGRGAYIGPNSSLDFTNVTFERATSSTGAGLAINSGQSVITDCAFEDNTASGLGGAIFASSADVTVIDSSFLNNSAGSGGHIYAGPSGSLTVVGSNFEGSLTTTLESVGAVHTSSVNTTLLSCTSDRDGGDSAFYLNGGFNTVNGLDIVEPTGTGVTFDNDTLTPQTVYASRIDVLGAGAHGIHTAGVGDLMTVYLTNSSASNSMDAGFEIMGASGVSVQVTNVTAVGNNTGIQMVVSGLIRNSIFAGNVDDIDDTAPFLAQADYNLFTDPLDASMFGSPTPSDNPLFQTYFSTLPADAWDLHITANSPAVDAGHINLADTDGSRSDIGRHGGPGGEGDWYEDIDSDSIFDGWEYKWFGNLYEANGNDPDVAGTGNGQEFLNGTEPLNPDTDGDGPDDEADTAPLDAATQ